MDLIILHCQSKHKVSVVNTEGNDITILDLKQAASDATDVPVESQKLIFKGKSLNEPSQLLKEIGLKNGSKVMLIGKKVDIEADANFKKIKEIEKKTADFEKKQLEIQEEIQGIQKGFLPDDLVADALKGLQKRLSVCQEEFMRLLEQLDTLSIDDNHMVIRSKRKATVQVIQQRLDFNDSLDKKIIEFSQP